MRGEGTPAQILLELGSTLALNSYQKARICLLILVSVFREDTEFWESFLVVGNWPSMHATIFGPTDTKPLSALLYSSID